MSQNNSMYFQTFQATKKLTQRFMQNQLLLLPLSGLPQTPKSIFSILLSSTSRFIPTVTSSHSASGFYLNRTVHPTPDSSLLFSEFLAFSFISRSPAKMPSSAPESSKERGSPPRHPSAAGEEKQSFFIRFVSLVVSKWDATLEACLVEIRNV